MSDDELIEIIVRAYTDKDGKVSLNEFYDVMTKKIYLKKFKIQNE